MLECMLIGDRDNGVQRSKAKPSYDINRGVAGSMSGLTWGSDKDSSGLNDLSTSTASNDLIMVWPMCGKGAALLSTTYGQL